MDMKLECKGGALLTTVPVELGRNYIVGAGGSEAGSPDIDLAEHDRRGRLQFRHAEIVVAENGDMWIADLGSSRGTTVNGRRLQPHDPCVLSLGDRVRFGRVVTCTLVCDIPPEDDPTHGSSDIAYGCCLGAVLGWFWGLIAVASYRLQNAREYRKRTGRTPPDWVLLHVMVALGWAAALGLIVFFVYFGLLSGLHSDAH